METQTILIIAGVVAAWLVIQFVVFPRLTGSCCGGGKCGQSECKEEKKGCCGSAEVNEAAETEVSGGK
jgi:hypothetical protein